MSDINTRTWDVPDVDLDNTDQTPLEQLNSSLDYVNNALNEISERIAGLGTKSAIVRKYVPLQGGTDPASRVSVGDLVYFNTSTGRFAKALAALDYSNAGANELGDSVEAESARVEGIVIGLDSVAAGTLPDNTVFGTLLCGGYWEDSNVMNLCIDSSAYNTIQTDTYTNENTGVSSGVLGNGNSGNDYATGVYYLSPSTPGKATKWTGGHLRQPVFTYYGNGKFNLSVFYMAHDNHFHGSLLLDPANWQAASGGSGYQYIDESVAYKNLGLLSDMTVAIFVNGILQERGGAFSVDSNGVLCYSGDTTPQGSITVFNSYPISYENPIVRNVESTNSAISVSTHNGLVRLTGHEFNYGDMANSSLAISSISNNIVNFTPVVSGLAPGLGIQITSRSNGIAEISTAGRINTPLDAYSIDHKGTNITSDDRYLYITFPAGRANSKFIMSMPVTDVTDDTVLMVKPWVMCKGAGTTFRVSAYFTPQPTADTPVGSTPSVQLENAALAVGGSAGYFYYGETSSGFSVTGKGLLTAVVGLSGNSGPSSDIQLLRVGFRLAIQYAPVASAVAGQDGSDINLVVGYARAQAGAVSAGNVVMLSSSGALVPCVNTSAANINRCVGVVIDASDPAAIKYAMGGIVSSVGSGLTIGAPVYVGSDGFVTQSIGQTAQFIQQVGVAVTSSTIQLNIVPGVLNTNNQ